MSKETNRLLGHTDEADGIDEYDNPLPDWWTGLFWFTMIWAVAYGVNYHFIAKNSPQKALAAEFLAAEARWPTVDPADVEFVMSPEAVAAGEQTYMTQCFICHGLELEGGIGTPLNDTEWLFGGSPDEVIATITNGSLEKGMPAWGPLLGPEAVNRVAAYVLSRNAELTGGTPPGG